ncbi:MAG: dihydroneopterin aldolase [Shimia sp.]
MTTSEPLAEVVLRDLILLTDIGTYGPDDVVPDAHFLDLVLGLDPALVLIPEDGMAHVFDYDPLVREIDRLSADGHYETQERLMTRIMQACFAEPAIRSVDITLRKHPVRDGSGSLGVRLRVTRDAMPDL